MDCRTRKNGVRDGDNSGHARRDAIRAFDKLGVSTRVELVLYCFHERQQSLLGGGRFREKAAAAAGA